MLLIHLRRVSARTDVLPWEDPGAGLRPAGAPPNSLGIDRSHPGRRGASSGAYRSTRCDGYTATGGYSETSRAKPWRNEPRMLEKLIKKTGNGESAPEQLVSDTIYRSHAHKHAIINTSRSTSAVFFPLFSPFSQHRSWKAEKSPVCFFVSGYMSV